MNNYIKEREISFRELFWKILAQWKTILIIALCFLLLGSAYAWYTGRHPETEELTTLVTDDVPDGPVVDYAAAEENILNAAHRYEKALANERNYLDNSRLMNLDPYHVVSTIRDIELKARGTTDINELVMVGRLLVNNAVNAEIINRIAAEYDMAPEYLREMITTGTRDQFDSGSETSSAAADTENGESAEEAAKNYYIYINVKGDSAEFTEAVNQEIIDYLVEKRNDINQIMYIMTPMLPVTSERIDTGLISSQNDSRARIYDYSDKLNKISTLLVNFDKAKATFAAEKKEALQESRSPRFDKKYVVLGFAVGIILAVVFLALKSIFSSTFQTEYDFHSRFRLNNLGTAPGMSGKRSVLGRSKRIWSRLEGSSSKLSQEEFFEMVSSNIAGFAGDFKNILFTGSVSQEDIQTVSAHVLPSLQNTCEGTGYVFAGDFLTDPKTRGYLHEADGVVLVEKRGSSKNRDIEKELQILSGLNKNVMGVVLL